VTISLSGMVLLYGVSCIWVWNVVSFWGKNVT